MQLYTPDPQKQDCFGYQPLKEDESGEHVEIVRLDTMLPLLPKINLLKLDVEGMEDPALAGAMKLIVRDRPLIFCENDRPSGSRFLITRLWAMDYDLWWHVGPFCAGREPC